MTEINPSEPLPASLWSGCIEKVRQHAGLLHLGTMAADSQFFELVPFDPRVPIKEGERHLVTCEVFQHPQRNLLVYVAISQVNTAAYGHWFRFLEVLPKTIVSSDTPGLFGAEFKDWDNPNYLRMGTGSGSWDCLNLFPHCGNGYPTGSDRTLYVPYRSFGPSFPYSGDADLLPDRLGEFVEKILRETRLLRHAVEGHLRHLAGMFPDLSVLAHFYAQCPGAIYPLWQQFPFDRLLTAPDSTCQADYDHYLEIKRKVHSRYWPQTP